MTFKIENIQGIGPVYAQKLSMAGILTTTDLLTHCSTVTGRKKVAKITDVSEQQILKWTNMADLMRVFGIGPQYSELLESAGVDTLKELRTRNATHLAAKMVEVNHFKNVCGAAPAESTVQDWIDCAQHMNPLISY